MLFHLSVENIALIEKAEINFNTGFNVLTGETGAGKSILINSVNMLIGERSSRDIIRSGETYAYVEGLFYLTPDSKAYLDRFDIVTDEDGCLIVSRRLFSDGKNVCKVGGKTVPVSTLREIGKVLINVHGQHDNQALFDSASHILFLDSAAADSEKKEFELFDEIFASLKEEEKKLNLICIDENEKIRKIDLLNYEINEISNANLYPGEEDELKRKRSIIKNKENINRNCSIALDVLYENNEGLCAYNLLSKAQRAVGNSEQSGEELEKVSCKLSEIIYCLEDVVDIIRNQLELAESSELSLDEIEERLDLIYRLKRKYGNNEKEILEYCKNAEKELNDINFSEIRKAEIEKNIEELRSKAFYFAEKNHKTRIKIAERIERQINSELAELNMRGAEFSVNFEECELCKNGIDKVEFFLSANIGEPLKPLSKIVSGGELSRIMLALKNVLSTGDMVGTLIFDEIDTGISGRTADKVGKKLSEIATKKQVLCITHLPQIAALSDTHFKISKEQNKNKTNTIIKSLNDEEKISEIALLIGGDNVTETTLAQASEMIKYKK